ncbi:substrate-binding domain-containing protein [uncultured Victivallis sp.]|uniref:substrate-binding domain-containing protein n=1 Tax=uncultured Victivallis sp. TaxID=354118 RepID=UPI0025CC12D5|nr:substrate-binding domain-containing protein [uncultured Victivallis sp.]
MPPLKYLKVKSYLEEVAVRPESRRRMPTVRELMSQFNVSLATVNRALSELENDGVIVRRQGSGIVAAGTERTVGRLEKDVANAGSGQILFAYNDYPDESTWRMVHTITQYTRLNKCNIQDCKIYPDTSTEALIRFAKSCPECAGLILLVGADRMDADRLEALGRLPMTVVIVDSMYFYANFLPDNVYVLSPDAVDCAEEIVELLVRNGHRRIGYIRNEPRTEYTDLFQKSLAAALKRANVEFGPDRIFSSQIRSWENSLDAAVQLTRNSLDEIKALGLTALIYKSAGGALVSLRVLKQAGLRVPEEISVIGEGERSLYRYLSPQLTVSSPDYGKLGCAAVDIILGKLRPQNHNLFFPHTLIERESVRDLNFVAPHP